MTPGSDRDRPPRESLRPRRNRIAIVRGSDCVRRRCTRIERTADPRENNEQDHNAEEHLHGTPPAARECATVSVMSLDQQLMAGFSQVAMLSCLVGLLRTGQWRRCYSFLAYVVAILTLGPLTTWVGGFFWTWGYWVFKQTIYQGLVLSLAAEMAWRVCRSHPKARTTMGRWAIAGLFLCGGALITQPWHPGLVTTIGEFHGRAVIAALFLLTSTLGVAAHYRLRVEHFHSLLMVGFAFYLALFGALLRMMLVTGPVVAHPYWRAIDPPAYALFSCWLAFVAWNRGGSAVAARKVA